MKYSRCEVCGNPTCADEGRCTNNRCARCHAQWCSPGGNDAPGHARLWPTVEYCQRCKHSTHDTHGARHPSDLLCRKSCNQRVGVVLLKLAARNGFRNDGTVECHYQREA